MSGVFRPLPYQHWRYLPPRPWIATSAYPLTQTLDDNFDDNSLDAAKWATFADPGATVAETGQQLSITLDNSSASIYGAIYAQNRYSLVGSYVYVKVATYPTQSANTEVYLYLEGDSAHYYMIHSLNGTVRAVYADGGSQQVVGSHVGTPPWWRIRDDSATVRFERSADGTSWTEIGSGVARHVWAGTLVPQIGFGHFASDIPSNTCVFDNFNVGEAVAGAKLLLLTGVGT